MQWAWRSQFSYCTSVLYILNYCEDKGREEKGRGALCLDGSLLNPLATWEPRARARRGREMVVTVSFDGQLLFQIGVCSLHPFLFLLVVVGKVCLNLAESAFIKLQHNLIFAPPVLFLRLHKLVDDVQYFICNQQFCLAPICKRIFLFFLFEQTNNF